MNTGLLRPAVATVLTVHGIETYKSLEQYYFFQVATVLTVHGIETYLSGAVGVATYAGCNSPYRSRY